MVNKNELTRMTWSWMIPCDSRRSLTTVMERSDMQEDVQIFSDGPDSRKIMGVKPSTDYYQYR